MNPHIYDTGEHPGKLHLVESLTDQDIAEFKALYKAYYGIDLPDTTAHEQALNLVRFIQAVHSVPMSQEEIEKLHRKRVSEILPTMKQAKVDHAQEWNVVFFKGWVQYIYPLYHAHENLKTTWERAEAITLPLTPPTPTQTALF
jgi:hypothetical protein